jgi:sugar phosphate isomerase/epimerase
VKLGATSFGFRYSFLDPSHAPPLTEVLQQARKEGVERFQVCENTRPLEMSRQAWRDTISAAADLGIELGLGCKTLRPAVVEQYMKLAAIIPTRRLRIVMEEDDGTHATPELAARLFEAVVPMLQKAGMQLAVENHFDIASATLVELAGRYPPDVVGFCVDTANSLRSFEKPLEVLGLLGGRACCYHLKDFQVAGGKVSFSVIGAPLGEGQLDLDGCLRHILARDAQPELYVETWTPSADDREKDVATEADWLRRSMRNLRQRVG